MSGKLVSAVLASGLAPWLKPYAVVYASYANDDGSRCWPSLKTVATSLGCSARQAQTATTALRGLGVLRIVQSRGPYRSTCHQFMAGALPPRPGQLRLLFDDSRFPQANPAKASIKTRFPQFPQALTGSLRHDNRKPTSYDPSMIRQFDLCTDDRPETGTCPSSPLWKSRTRKAPR